METLRIFGHYSIVSEKIDNCPCKYDDSISLMTVFIGLISAVFFVAAIEFGVLIFIIAFSIICVIGFFGGLIICAETCSCGIKIKLKDTDYIDLTIISKQIQFTNNPENDALEIKTIIDDFEKYFNKIDITNKNREYEKLKLQKECCDKYKSVIKMVR
jgi:hypothetical protein